jgi:hypothetical protein
MVVAGFKEITVSEVRFSPGRCLITPGALDELESLGIPPILLLLRHLAEDWGELPKPDRDANRRAISQGGRIFSAYTVPPRTRVYVITEADRSHTTILLADEY